MEKAKEHYMDRLRREWAEAEAEAAVKARIAEEAITASATCQSRPMYSSNCEDVSGSPESNRVDLEEVIVEDGKMVLPNITSHCVKILLVWYVKVILVCDIVLTVLLKDAGDGIAVDADEIAAQIEEERKKQLDLLSKLFPEDKGAG